MQKKPLIQKKPSIVINNRGQESLELYGFSALAELGRTTGSLQAVLCQKCEASVCEGIFIQSEKGGGVWGEGVGMSGCDMTNI